jgi:hypothetical protein
MKKPSKGKKNPRLAARRVTFSSSEVREFMLRWPASGLRGRSLWFEFDHDGNLVDTNVGKREDGPAARALSEDASNLLVESGVLPGWARKNPRRGRRTEGGVEPEAMDALWSAFHALDGDEELYQASSRIRDFLTSRVAEYMSQKTPRFSFSSDYRHGATQAHELYYHIINTVEANYQAGKLK